MDMANVGEPVPVRMTSESDKNSVYEFRIGQRVHSAADTGRIGTVKYTGPLEGISGTWVGVDWDNDGDGKHDGSHNGISYFHARGPKTGSFCRPHNLSSGITLLQALEVRYRIVATKEEEDEMYVLSSSNRRVSVEFLGKDKIQVRLSKLDELSSASLPFLGVSSPGPSSLISETIPNTKELDLTGNLLSDWNDIAIICKEVPSLSALNLSYNLMSSDISSMPQLKNIKILVLNHTGIIWKQVEALKDSVPHLEELHLMGNDIREITPTPSVIVEGFDSLRILNLEDNCLTDWGEVIKLSQLRSMEQLLLNKNNLNKIHYPDIDVLHKLANNSESPGKAYRPFENLRCLLLGANTIEDMASVDSLNSFPNLVDIRLSENPVADPGRGGAPRFVLVGRLSKIQILNGSEISHRERRDSEIRYVRLVMTKETVSMEDITQRHPRFAELKVLHGIEDVQPSTGAAGPQKLSSGLISITLKWVGASGGEKPQLKKKLPSTTTVGKLKSLCETFFKLRNEKPKLFLEEGGPLPTLLEDDMASLVDLGVSNDSTILVDEEC